MKMIAHTRSHIDIMILDWNILINSNVSLHTRNTIKVTNTMNQGKKSGKSWGVLRFQDWWEGKKGEGKEELKQWTGTEEIFSLSRGLNLELVRRVPYHEKNSVFSSGHWIEKGKLVAFPLGVKYPKILRLTTRVQCPKYSAPQHWRLHW